MIQYPFSIQSGTTAESTKQRGVHDPAPSSTIAAFTFTAVADPIPANYAVQCSTSGAEVNLYSDGQKFHFRTRQLRRFRKFPDLQRHCDSEFTDNAHASRHRFEAAR